MAQLSGGRKLVTRRVSEDRVPEAVNRYRGPWVWQRLIPIWVALDLRVFARDSLTRRVVTC